MFASQDDSTCRVYDNGISLIRGSGCDDHAVWSKRGVQSAACGVAGDECVLRGAAACFASDKYVAHRIGRNCISDIGLLGAVQVGNDISSGAETGVQGKGRSTAGEHVSRDDNIVVARAVLNVSGGENPAGGIDCQSRCLRKAFGINRGDHGAVGQGRAVGTVGADGKLAIGNPGDNDVVVILRVDDDPVDLILVAAERCGDQTRRAEIGIE